MTSEQRQLNQFKDFDKYCLENNIQEHELGAAFGAWLNKTTGWDGKIEKVKE